MKLIPLTQGKFALVDDEDYDFLMQWKWSYYGGYAHRGEWQKNTKKIKKIRMHRLIMQTPHHMQTDHIDGNGINNQKNNLRIVTHGQNMQNKNSHNGTQSRHKGVYPVREKFRGMITPNKKRIHLGYFLSETEAAEAYNKAALEHFGEFARLNII